MLFSKVFNKTTLTSTYCRQYALKCYIKRCFCAVRATEVGTSVEANTDTDTGQGPRRRKANVAVVSQGAQDTLLYFFNNCDHVTLNKLSSSKKKQFMGYNFEQVYKKQFTEERYLDIDDFLKRTGVTHDRVEDMASSIIQFEKTENSSSSMKIFHPTFNRRNVEDIDKVVVLDVFQSYFAWCVRSTEDDYITDIGFRKLGLKDSYDHVSHHKEIRMFLEIIPESEVYLLRSNTVQGALVSKKASRHAVHQAIIEAMIMTLLNERHLPNDMYFSKQSDDDRTRARFLNKVHLFQPIALKDFYEVTFGHELLNVSDLFKKWYAGNHPNIRSWGLDEDERRTLFHSRGAGQVSVCALMSDVFCRSLRKTQKQFPHAYT